MLGVGSFHLHFHLLSTGFEAAEADFDPVFSEIEGKGTDAAPGN